MCLQLPDAPDPLTLLADVANADAQEEPSPSGGPSLQAATAGAGASLPPVHTATTSQRPQRKRRKTEYAVELSDTAPGWGGSSSEGVGGGGGGSSDGYRRSGGAVATAAMVEGASRRVAALRAAAGAVGAAAAQQQEFEVEEALAGDGWCAPGSVVLVQDPGGELGCYWAAVVADGGDMPVEVAEGGTWPMQQQFPHTLEVTL